MWSLRIYTKIYSVLMLTPLLLFLLEQPTSATFTEGTYIKTIANDNIAERLLKSPAKIQEAQIDVLVSKSVHSVNVTIECKHINDNVYGELLPQMSIGDVNVLCMKYCPLPSKSITHLRDQLGIKNLNSLYLYQNHNSNYNFNSNVLSGLSDLKMLHLEGTDLSHIPENLFMNLTNLEELNLISNNLKLTSHIFDNLTNLRFLNLSSNNLHALPVGIVRNQSKLETLDLRDNQLRDNHKAYFNTTSSIRYLDLSSNGISNFQPDVFAQLANLTKIILNDNRLRELPKDLFSSNKKLEHILMLNNNMPLKALPLFANLKGLKSIYITCKMMMNLADTFESDIVRINCALREIPADLFENSSKFATMLLNDNELETLPATLFAKQDRLKILDLSHNHLQTLPVELFADTPNLTELKLSYNQLNEIPSGIFTNLRNLKVLELNNNRLMTITPGAFVQTKVINTEKISLEKQRVNHQNRVHVSHVKVQLNNNPINCDCNLLPFVEHLHSHELNQLNLIVDKLLCDSPLGMHDFSVTNVERKALLCPLGPPHCPHDCSCWTRPHDAVLIVNCSSKSLKEVPILPRVQAIALKSIELHIENNVLRKLPTVSTTTGYADVTKMYAAGNELSQIDVLNLPRNLTYLDLSRNKFQELSSEVLQFFNHSKLLTKIALSENPWSCGCKNKPLLEFIKKPNSAIFDINKMYCANPTYSNMTYYLNDKKVCHLEQTVLNILTVIFLFICFIITLMIALYYKYRITIIRSAWYKSWCVKKPKLNTNKKYDLFVSYSDQDEQLAMEQLVPVLEQDPTAYKLCYRTRDFAVGEYYPDQIIGAIYNSTRTILILSKHFIETMWIHWEFRIAHQAALHDDRTSAIVIIRGDIGDICSLDAELQEYLKDSTNLIWGEPWFWHKLRYILSGQLSKKQKKSINQPTFKCNGYGGLDLDKAPMKQTSIETDV